VTTTITPKNHVKNLKLHLYWTLKQAVSIL
jgi:hypothetical protein